MPGTPRPPHVAIIGAGFSGLAAAWELTRRGVAVTVLEADDEVGGLAGSFEVGGTRLEKFYHHWFTNDADVTTLVRELGAEDRIVFRPTRTGMYFAQRFFKLSTPPDVLRFTPLSILGRLRLGVLALRARRVKDWRALEHLTAEEWLTQLGGREVYRVVWAPLLAGKFGSHADEISAVWFWNKLKLRGGSRDQRGAEMLAYYRGGFAALAERLAEAVEERGGRIRLRALVTGLAMRDGRVAGVQVGDEVVAADAVIATPALPIVADLVSPHAATGYTASLRRVRYLANVCLVLELDRSLSSTYWLNVNDPTFPFVGIIEHTNFEPAETYAGRHIVYLSKYLPEDAPLWRMSDDEVLEFSLPHLQRMFPAFSREWILAAHVWRARHSQPLVVRHYGALIPETETPLGGVYLATMAQVYPEDRGTNYAIREGRAAARLVADRLAGAPRDTPRDSGRFRKAGAGPQLVPA
ncbi:MAG TPA: NAD(P)/FAD-dependent oxidoreductase [Gemmatimonadales bacterium]|nr:NAD(P)/FAD-dependent oxidoreductase [Gemmatimonadales bacterium]